MSVTTSVLPDAQHTAEKTAAEVRAPEVSASRWPFVPAWFRDAAIAELKGPALAIALCYISHADRKGGFAWPSIRRLCRETGYCKDVVKSARRKLMAIRFLREVEQEKIGGKFGRKVFAVNREWRPAPGVTKSATAPEMIPSSPIKAPSVSLSATAESATKVFHVEGTPEKSTSKVKGSRKSARLRGTGDYDHATRSTGKKTSLRKLETNIAAKIADGAGDGCLCANEPDECDWISDARACANAIGYTLDENSPLVSFAFANAMAEAWRKHRDAGLPAGLLAQKVLDLCVTTDFETPWPPDFQMLRDRLREAEHSSEEK